MPTFFERIPSRGLEKKHYQESSGPAICRRSLLSQFERNETKIDVGHYGASMNLFHLLAAVLTIAGAVELAWCLGVLGGVLTGGITGFATASAVTSVCGACASSFR
jgi:hypothetical protein